MHVDDVARAVIKLLDGAVVGPVNIASGDALALAEVVDRVAQAAGGPGLVRRGALPDRSDEPPLLVADVSRLRDEVGFQPAIDLETGIADSVAYWRQMLLSRDANAAQP
jgi:nucleoside-diphosphate-sugar epimerase